MLVLASASPRRQQLLRNAGISFVVQPAQIPEDPLPGESPRACAERLAREKARAIFLQRPNDIVLGADTVVFVDGEMLAKPCDAADATCMLRLLGGKTHQVITGVCLIGALGTNNQELKTGLQDARSPAQTRDSESTAFEDVRSELTLVTVAAISDEEIGAYIATGEPMDKAGAYGIQGMASRWIPRIEGDYFNVVGLPVALVWRMLREHGAI
jgi:nucleoside triphosphate pyrophosphatase